MLVEKERVKVNKASKIEYGSPVRLKPDGQIHVLGFLGDRRWVVLKEHNQSNPP